MNKKYLPSALILYLNYFIHGVGCSILGQAVIKEALAAAWGVEAMAITAISAALGLGRLIALPFAGPLSDKLGRRISTAIGSASYAIYLIGLALAFNAGTHGGYTIAYVCAIIGGIANSFLDTGIYPAICLVTMIAVLMGQSKPLMIAGAFIIGWAGAGGLLQIATSVCNMLFPKIKGTVTALVMIASSLCNYTILTAASKMQPSGVMTMNIVLTAVGVALGLFVNIRYKKMVELAQQDN